MSHIYTPIYCFDDAHILHYNVNAEENKDSNEEKWAG